MHQVTIEDTQETYPCPAERTLLEGMEALGRRGIPVGCRGGGCGICKVRVIEGEYVARKMSRAWVSAEEQAEHVVLACRAYPAGPLRLQVVGKMLKGLNRHRPDADPAACSTEISQSLSN